MKKIRVFTEDVEDISGYISQCEDSFDRQLLDLCDDIIKKDIKIVTLCGPTCSGKTTSSRKLQRFLCDLGKKTIVLSFDDFYKSRKEIIDECNKKGIDVEFESASTLDLNLLGSVIKNILSLQAFKSPIYDFKSGERSGFCEYKSESDTVFIFEGIQALYAEIEECFSSSVETYRVFIDVFCDLDSLYDIDCSDIRFARRVVRDRRCRNSTAYDTYKMWQSVRDNEIKNIYPNISKSDFILNSFLPYELGVIKPFILFDLNEIQTDDDGFTHYCKKITDIYEKFDEIRSDIVPTGSVLKEFIG